MAAIGTIEAHDWATGEFGHAVLGDERRTRRLIGIARGVLMRPGGTIGAVFDNLAELHGAYDFVENDAVPPTAIAAAMGVATATRARAFAMVWIATDGSSVTIADRKRGKETGRVGASTFATRGDKIHSALVLDPDGIPLGLCAQTQWQRGKGAHQGRPQPAPDAGQGNPTLARCARHGAGPADRSRARCHASLPARPRGRRLAAPARRGRWRAGRVHDDSRPVGSAPGDRRGDRGRAHAVPARGAGRERDPGDVRSSRCRRAPSARPARR
jgi:hypothetical protein